MWRTQSDYQPRKEGEKRVQREGQDLKRVDANQFGGWSS